MKNILFVTWDGPQTNYIESLFLPIFLKMQERYGYKFHIIQFTWGSPERIVKTKVVCSKYNIVYNAVPVYRKIAIVGLLKAIFVQSGIIRKYCRENNITLIMPRATTSAGIVNHIISSLNAKYIYDADGFSQDERVDFSGWSPTGLKYKLYRWMEKRAILQADAILCRSHQAAAIIAERSRLPETQNKITVISNGRDIVQYNILPQSEFKIGNGMKFIYVGSLGPQYGLENMLNVFKAVKNILPDSVFTILTGDKSYANQMIEDSYQDIRNSVLITRVAADAVPNYIIDADFAFALRAQKFSMKGVSPIKLGEYLLCGIPVIATSGIGDTDMMLDGENCAYVISDYDDVNIDAIVEWCTAVWGEYKIKQQAREIGLAYFDLNKTVDLYYEAIRDGK